MIRKILSGLILFTTVAIVAYLAVYRKSKEDGSTQASVPPPEIRRSGRTDKVSERTIRERWVRALSQAPEAASDRKTSLIALMKGGINSDDAEMALKSILTEFGPGRDQDELIYNWCLRTDLPISDTLEMLCTLPEGSAASNAAVGLVARIATCRDSRYIEEIAELGASLDSDELSTLVSGLACRVDPSVMGIASLTGGEGNELTRSEKEARFKESMVAFAAILDVKGAEETPDLVADFFQTARIAAPLAAWTELAKIRDDNPTLLRKLDQTYYDILVSQMVRQNPMEAISKLATNESLESNRQMSVGILGWLQADSKAANSWIEAEALFLGEDVVAAAKTASVEHSLMSSDFTKAREVAAQVKDLEVRNALEQKIREGERQQVLKSINENPRQFLEEIIVGNSKYNSSWIDDSIAAWAEKDALAAYQWYEEKKRGLSKQQNESVVSAYARLAMKHRDIETAHQWLELVTTPELKMEIAQELESIEDAKLIE